MTASLHIDRGWSLRAPFIKINVANCHYNTHVSYTFETRSDRTHVYINFIFTLFFSPLYVSCSLLKRASHVMKCSVYRCAKLTQKCCISNQQNIFHFSLEFCRVKRCPLSKELRCKLDSSLATEWYRYVVSEVSWKINLVIKRSTEL